MDPRTKPLLGIVGGILVIASITGAILSRRCRNDAAASTIANLNARIRSWWVMAGIFSATILLGSVFTTVLFALLSFPAMREFITLNRTGRADHEILFWAFFVILPLPYFLVGIQWYGLFAIFIPVYAFVFIPIRRVLTGESKNFLMRTARIQWALLICVYAVSHKPMLLALPIAGFEGKNANLLFFFVLTVQLSDVLQYVWGKTRGKQACRTGSEPPQDPGGHRRRDRLDRAREHRSPVGAPPSVPRRPRRWRSSSASRDFSADSSSRRSNGIWGRRTGAVPSRVTVDFLTGSILSVSRHRSFSTSRPFVSARGRARDPPHGFSS
jgi:predicted CDP-diglyceride synthetase/phosphatidate cytidylyltransferase